MLKVLSNWVLTKEALFPEIPVKDRAPEPMLAAVKVPPVPIVTVPLLAMSLVMPARTSKVAPEFTVTVPLESAPELEALNVPPETTVPPEYVFAPLRTNVPVPDLVKTGLAAAPDPEEFSSAEAMTTVPPLATRMAPLLWSWIERVPKELPVVELVKVTVPVPFWASIK